LGFVSIGFFGFLSTCDAARVIANPSDLSRSRENEWQKAEKASKHSSGCHVEGLAAGFSRAISTLCDAFCGGASHF